MLYYAICKVWPTQNQKIIREVGLSWEQNSDLEEGFAEDGTIIIEEGKVESPSISSEGGIFARVIHSIQQKPGLDRQKRARYTK